ncbi:MAG: AbrB/MazE/SpoVT family DNA-binding domain-containing protein [Usitatibacter sp.]
MLAKLTSKNQLTLPKALMSLFPGTRYFEVSEEGGRIVLTPLDLRRGDAVRAKLAELGIDSKDVRDAVRWSRAGK